LHVGICNGVEQLLGCVCNCKSIPYGAVIYHSAEFVLVLLEHVIP